MKEAAWKYWTFQEYHDTSLLFARALVALGFQPHGVINILGFNAPEWFFAYMGAMMAGGVAAGIYITNGPEACHVRVVCVVWMGRHRWHGMACMVWMGDQRLTDPTLSLHTLLKQKQYITAHSDAEVVVVDDVAQLKKYAMATQEQLPRLKVSDCDCGTGDRWSAARSTGMDR